MSNTTRKPTIVSQYEELIQVLEANGLLTEDRKAFLEKRIEITAKKNASSGGTKKLTPVQIANQGVAIAIYEYLHSTASKMTITEMVKTIPVCSSLSNQKINGILTKLYDSEKHPNPNPMFIRSEEKGVAKFEANPDFATAEVEGE